MESLIVSIIDTTIAAQNMVATAEIMDLGICYIGGIRNDIQKVAKLLKLPKYTVPLLGLAIGIPNNKNQKNQDYLKKINLMKTTILKNNFQT